jgi:plastocyanin
MESKLVHSAMTAVGAMGLALLTACGSSTSPSSGGGGGGGGGYGGGGGGAGGGHTTTITVGNNVFTPTPDTVAAGQVTFTWSTPSNGHTVTWDSGPGTTLPAGSGQKSSGTYAATLQAGTYQYHCENHGSPGSGMHGTIVVQ